MTLLKIEYVDPEEFRSGGFKVESIDRLFKDCKNIECVFNNKNYCLSKYVLKYQETKSNKFNACVLVFEDEKELLSTNIINNLITG